jgi:hypothetical protein
MSLEHGDGRWVRRQLNFPPMFRTPSKTANNGRDACKNTTARNERTTSKKYGGQTICCSRIERVYPSSAVCETYNLEKILKDEHENGWAQARAWPQSTIGIVVKYVWMSVTFKISVRSRQSQKLKNKSTKIRFRFTAALESNEYMLTPPRWNHDFGRKYNSKQRYQNSATQTRTLPQHIGLEVMWGGYA